MGRLLIQLPGTTTAKALTETLSKNVIIVDEDLHQLRLHDGTTAGGHLIGGSSGSGVPVGTIIPFAGNSIPQGYLLCDGSAISRTTYASLFAVIGTIYGAGDGNSTFNLPSFNGGYPICGVLSINSVSKANTPQAGVLPKIIGSLWTGDQINTVSAKFHTPTGAFAVKSGTANYTAPGNATANTSWGFDFDASRSSSVYSGTDNKVLPTRYATRFFIKYI